MYFEFNKHVPEVVNFKTLIPGDVFRYHDNIFIKLHGCTAISIYDDVITEMRDDSVDVELIDYKIIIYSEE